MPTSSRTIDPALTEAGLIAAPSSPAGGIPSSAGAPMPSRAWSLGESLVPRWAVFILVTLVLIVLTVVLDLAVIGRSLSEKGAPDYSPAHLIRTGLLAAAAVLFVISLETRARARHNSALNYEPGRALLFALVPLVAAAAFIALLVRDPFLFYSHAREDALLETAQVCMILVAAGLFAVRQFRDGIGPGARPTRSFLPILVALGLLLVAAEELSWGQRLFGFDAAGPFTSNEQQETNLHNFGTHEFELAYYFGLFAVLGLAAYVSDRTGLGSRVPTLAAIAPSSAVLLAATPAIAFNFGEWNQITTQLAVLTTLAILVAYVVRAVRHRPTLRPLIAVAIALVGFVAVQAALLLAGGTMLRWWQNTEYKEFLGSLAILLWAIEVAQRPRFTIQ